MHRIGGNRIRLDLDAFVEVEPIHAWTVQVQSIALGAAFQAAQGPAAEINALAAWVDHFVTEAQPQWDYVDHHGPVPPNGRGMMTLPLETMAAMIAQWQDSLNVKPEREPLPFSVIESDAPSAADALLPPAAAREVKRQLRRRRAA